MRYFKAKNDQIIYHLPEPLVRKKSHKGKVYQFILSASLAITYANNPDDPATSRLTKAENKSCRKTFEARDAGLDMIGEFYKTFQPDDSEEITFAVYSALKSEYANKQ